MLIKALGTELLRESKDINVHVVRYDAFIRYQTDTTLVPSYSKNCIQESEVVIESV